MNCEKANVYNRLRNVWISHCLKSVCFPLLCQLGLKVAPFPLRHQTTENPPLSEEEHHHHPPPQEEQMEGKKKEISTWLRFPPSWS